MNVAPGDYEAIEHLIRTFIDRRESGQLDEMGAKGRAYLENHLTKEVSIRKYRDALLSCRKAGDIV